MENLEYPLCVVCQDYITVETINITSCGGKIICTPCISSIKELNEKCPHCQEYLNGHFLLGEPKKIYIDKYKNSQYNCTNDNCEKLLKYDEFVEHINSCEYKFILCKNKGCKGYFNSVKNHEKKCLYKIIECKDCNSLILNKDMIKHNENCLKKVIKCKYDKCNYKSKRYMMDIHDKTCIYKIYECINQIYGCNFIGLIKSIQYIEEIVNIIHMNVFVEKK